MDGPTHHFWSLIYKPPNKACVDSLLNVCSNCLYNQDNGGLIEIVKLCLECHKRTNILSLRSDLLTRQITSLTLNSF